MRDLKKEFTDIRPEEISFENGSRRGVKESEVEVEVGGRDDVVNNV